MIDEYKIDITLGVLISIHDPLNRTNALYSRALSMNFLRDAPFSNYGYELRTMAFIHYCKKGR